MELYKRKDGLTFYYNIEKMSISEIAKMCNRGQTTIWNWLKKLNIPIRSEAHHLATGNHCNLSTKAKRRIDGE